MKRSRSEKKSTVYVSKKLKNRKTGKSSLEMGACEGVHDIKEENIADESEPAASSTLTEEWKTAMSKLVRAMAILCFIYEVDFNNLMKEHEHCLGDYLSGREDFFWQTLCTTYEGIQMMIK